MELILLPYLLYAFTLGMVAGTLFLCIGLVLGRVGSEGGFKSIFKREKQIDPADIPGTEEYYEKAKLPPEAGGHENPFEQDLIDLARHSE
jgi:hypothetical protein